MRQAEQHIAIIQMATAAIAATANMMVQIASNPELTRMLPCMDFLVRYLTTELDRLRDSCQALQDAEVSD
jgi:hypothetical protein